MTAIVWIDEAVARYERPLVAYAWRLAGDLEAARDAVQDTFMRLCDQPEDAVRSHLAEWLFTVCRNRCLDHLRRCRTERPMDATADEPASETHPAAPIEASESSAGLLVALASLPSRHQEVVRLKFQGGCSYREISRITKLTEGNIGFIIHTAIQSLRAKLAADPVFADRAARTPTNA